MHPAVFLVALLSTVGIAAFTIIKVARVFANRAGPSADVTERLDDLERAVQSLQQELAETHQRLDFAERLLTTARDQRQIGG
jgi:endonuclease V-like protein UPF0215 family